jgi:hypothetical protein
MKKIIAIIIIAIVLGTGFYYFWKNHNISIVKDNFSVFKDIASETEKSTWQTYSNPTAKYSFKYPAGLNINPMNDRAVYFRYKDANSMANFAIFYQDIFDGKPVVVTDSTSFKNEVNRRTAGLFNKGDQVVGHETAFAGKPTIVMEDKNDSSREIFVWQGNQVLQIEIAGKMQKNESFLNKILSTFSFN